MFHKTAGSWYTHAVLLLIELIAMGRFMGLLSSKNLA